MDGTLDTKEQMTVMNVPQGCTPKRAPRNVKIVRKASLWMNLAAVQLSLLFRRKRAAVEGANHVWRVAW